jgi:membrane-associated protease RseP (regulator of RpoE activity)
MRTNQRILTPAGIIGSLAACPFALLHAIEPPPENAKPPAALLGGEQDKRAASAKLPFLGLSTAGLPDMVADHLGIEDGSGVIIRTVCPDSPAEKAGLAVNDIILSLGGAPVGDPDAFSEKIRAHKAGDRLELELIRKGKPDKAEVTLTERPAELNAHLAPEPFLHGLPQDQADRLRGLIEQNLQGFGADHLGILPDQRFENSFRMMRERMNRAFEEEIPPIIQGEDGGIRFQQNSTVRLMDDQGSVEIRSSDGDTQVTLRDTANNIAWQGPWNSEKDKEAAPPDVRERIDRVNVGSANGRGFTFRFGKLGGKPDIIDN